MIEIVDGVITIPNWGKHQSLDAYERKKERDRENKRRKRAEQKALAQKSDDVVARQSPATSTDSSKSRSLEEEGEEDKKEIRGRVEENTELPHPLYKQIMKLFADNMGSHLLMKELQELKNTVAQQWQLLLNGAKRMRQQEELRKRNSAIFRTGIMMSLI